MASRARHRERRLPLRNPDGGEGGIVSDSARLDPSVFVAREAEVWPRASVGAGTQIRRGAREAWIASSGRKWKSDREADEFGQVGRLHLGHHVGAIDLHRAGTDAVVVGDRLVGKSCDESLQHLALARAEGSDAGGNLRRDGPALGRVRRNGHSRSNRIDHPLIFEGFFDEVVRSEFHGFDRQRHVAMPGHQDYRISRRSRPISSKRRSACRASASRKGSELPHRNGLQKIGSYASVLFRGFRRTGPWASSSKSSGAKKMARAIRPISP